VYERKISKYVKKGKKGQEWDYYKLNIPRELFNRDVFLTQWGEGFLTLPHLENVREYAFRGFWHGTDLFLPSSEPPPDYAIAIGKAGPYNIFQIDKFSLWRSQKDTTTILRDLQKLADGIPGRITSLVEDVKEKQGKVTLLRKENNLFIQIAEEKLKEEIDKILTGLWLSKKQSKLKNRSYHVMLRLLRYNYLPIFEEKVKELTELPHFELKVPLRPYQEKTVEEFMKRGRLTCVHPHGSGKTITALACMQRIRGRTLIVTEKTDLTQWFDKIKNVTTLPTRLVGILGGGKHEVAPVTLTTFGSFHHVAGKYWSLIVTDEVHRLPARKHAPLAAVPCDYFLGLSGSPFREAKGETAMIYALAGAPDSQGSIWTDFYGTWVFRPTVYVHRVPFQSKFYKDKYEAEPDQRKKFIIAGSNPIKTRYLNYYLAKYQKVLIFCRWLKQANSLAKKLSVPFLHGDSSLKERQIICEWMRKEPKAIAVFTEAGVQGVDIPSLECVITLSGNYGSRRESLQMAGRVMRMVKGKKCAVFIYIVTSDSLEEFFLKKRLAVLEEKNMPILYVD